MPTDTTLIDELAEVGTELREELGELRDEVVDLGAELQGELTDLGREVRVELKHALGRVIDARRRRQVGALFVNIVVAAGLVAAVAMAFLA